MAWDSVDVEFWLEFQIFDDGLDSPHAQKLASRRADALEFTGENTHAEAQHSSNSFQHFQSLPTELRLKIWDYLIAPRTVQIQCYVGHVEETIQSPRASSGYHILPHKRRDCPPHSLIPVILHINRESRNHGLKHYELTFSWKVPHVLAGADILGSGPSASHMSNIRGHSRAASESQAIQSNSRQQPQLPKWSQPHVYFNYALDAVYLVGELEPYNRHGFNSPMTYFLRKEDCLRVRHVAVSFDALHYGETASQQIFGTLFHVVDRFHPPHNHVLITVQPRDEITHVLLGADRPLIPGFSLEQAAGAWNEANESTHSPGENEPMMASERASYDGPGPRTNRDNDVLSARQTIYSGITRELQANTSDDNLVQKLWLNWYRGSVTRSSLASIRFDLVHVCDLGGYIENLEVSLRSRDKQQRELDRLRREEEYHNPPPPPLLSTNGEHVMRVRSTTMTSFADEEEDYASIPPGLEALALR